MKNDLKFNITLLSVSGEEIMSEGGSKYVLKNHFNELNAVTVIGEGATELSELVNYEGDEHLFGISLAHKRPFWVELNVNVNSSGHGSVTPENYASKEIVQILSRLTKMKTPFIYTKENVKVLKTLASMKKGLGRFILNNPHLFKCIIASELRKQPEVFSLFTNTVTLTSINSEDSVINVISQSASAKLDCRLLPHYSEEKFLKELKKKIKNDNVQLRIINYQPPTPVSNSDNIHYKNLENAVRETYKNSRVFPIILPNYNDAGNFRLHGVQSYSIIPVEIGMEYLKCVHAPNERIPISAIYLGMDVYFNYLKLSEYNNDHEN